MLSGGISVVIGLFVSVFGFGVVGSSLAEAARKKWGVERASLYRKLSRYAGPIIIAGGLAAIVSAGRVDERVEAEAIVSEMKARLSLPVQVDATTRLDDVRAVSKSEIEYVLTLTSLTKAELTKNPIASMLEGSLRRGACLNPDYVRFFDADFSVRITYQTMDQAKVVEVVLKPSDCES